MSKELITRLTVSCDDYCGAYEHPETLNEYKAAHEHWKHHGFASGCSHGA